MILSVKKAMDIVDVVADKGRVTIKELSTTMAMPKSTVCRLAQTLEASGYLEQDQATGEYLLSYKFFRVGYEILEKAGIRNCVMPVLQQLASITNETVNFSVLDGNKVLYVEKVESSPIYGGIKVGARGPLHCTASGKAMLANLHPKKLQDLVDQIQPLEAYTAHTIVTVEALLRDLAKYRVRGFSQVQDELGNGANAVAAYVSNYPGREAAAVSIAGSQNRFTDGRLDELGKLVATAAQEISQRFKV